LPLGRGIVPVVERDGVATFKGRERRLWQRCRNSKKVVRREGAFFDLLPPLSLARSIVFCELPPLFFLLQPLLCLQKETLVVLGSCCLPSSVGKGKLRDDS
jgi:hypothetical protein